MSKETKEALQKEDTQDMAGGVDSRRRRLLRAGASSSLLLTIASRPAWAQSAGAGSALVYPNASGGVFEAQSISAGWWDKERNYGLWPDQVSPYDLFHNHFNKVEAEVRNKGTKSTVALYDGMTMGRVIGLKGGQDPVQGTFGFHLVGALLNAYEFNGYRYSPSYIISSYNALNGQSMASFNALKTRLETANNEYDSITGKPDD